jgi:hypothetical protein
MADSHSSSMAVYHYRIDVFEINWFRCRNYICALWTNMVPTQMRAKAFRKESGRAENGKRMRLTNKRTVSKLARTRILSETEGNAQTASQLIEGIAVIAASKETYS